MKSKGEILIAEDDLPIAQLMATTLQKAGFSICGIVQTAEDVITKANLRKPDLALVDILLKGNVDGIQAVKQIHSSNDLPVIYVSGLADDGTLKRAIATKPVEYLIKPVCPSQLLVAVELAFQRLTPAFPRHGHGLEMAARALIGSSTHAQRIRQQIAELAAVDSTVLIDGDTGTGKEVVAHCIHSSSRRRERPFITVSCPALTDSLLASQLFGHKRGAFTGASEDHQGLFEAANGGTIFLDEIESAPLSVQTSLLRVLEEREIMRLGESRSRQVDVRVLVATNRDLDGEVAKGHFRSDLLYRIRVARIVLPPLHERRDDIPELVDLFIAQCRTTIGKPLRDISATALEVLTQYPWPGNIRELRNAIEFAGIRSKGFVIEPEDLPPEIMEFDPQLESVPGGDSGDMGRIQAALAKANGNRTTAARLLSISRATLYRRLQRS